MIGWLIVFPVLIPMMIGSFAFFFRYRVRTFNILVIGGSLATLLSAITLFYITLVDGINTVQFGNWPAPFGIVFVSDIFSTLLVLFSSIISFCVMIYAIADLKDKPSYCFHMSLMLFLISGIHGAFLTGDIFNLYVWFEIMLISSFGLMITDGKKIQIDAATKFVVLNLISTMAFLLAIGLIYAQTGTLNMADLHLKMAAVPDFQKMIIAAFFLFGFGIKSALFPVYAWLPASYHTLPSAVVALFSALLTKVGIYALIRFFTLVVPLDQIGWQDLLIPVSALGMVIGVFGAATQSSIKRILAFHSISQIGYMIIGLAVYTPLALIGSIFYVIHHIFVKANLFLIGGILIKKYGSDALEKLGGAYKTMPLLAFLFLITAFSLAGFPPLSGFWVKFAVIKASIFEAHYILAAAALFTGTLTLYSMSKIWSQAFWKAAPETQETQKLSTIHMILLYMPVAFLCLCTILMGIFAEPLFEILGRAVEDLINPDAYISAVLGKGENL